MRITIGLAQIYPKLGDVAHNLAVHLDTIQQARERGVDLLVFPELSMTGYQVQDLVPEVALRADPGDPVFAELLEASRDIDIVVGFVHEDKRSRFYIANAYLAARRNPCTFASQALPAHLRHVRRIALLRPAATASAPSIPALDGLAC